MKWVWIGVAALFGVAAFATWYAFNNPAFVWWFFTSAVAALIGSVLSIRKTPQQIAEEKRRQREGDTNKEGGR